MKKKVAFIIPTLGGGGAEKVLINLLNNLNMEQYDITLIALFKGGVNLKYLSDDIKYIYFFKNTFRGSNFFFKLFSPQYLYKKIIKQEYDIIISYLEGSTTRIVSGCSYKRTLLISWVHIEIPDDKNLLKSYRSSKEITSSYNKFDKIVFVSNTAKQTFESTFKSIETNMEVIYNTVDSNMILRKSKDIIDDVKFNEDKINMISVGRFIEQKGYKRLIEIINKIKDDFDIHLYLIGKGPLEENYIKLIKKYNLQEVITILGYKDNPYKYVANCDLFICSSYKEGFSTAVTESLIVGTPVITTECSGMTEMLGGNNDYGVVINNDDNALYEGLKELLRNKDLLDYYKKKAEKRSNYFSTKRTVKEVENMFVDIMGKWEK